MTIETEEGNRILHQKAEPVTEFGAELNKFCRNMLRVMRSERGMGLAAPQVGVSLRIIVIATSQNNEKILINPEIIEASESKKWIEGCLSVPGRRYRRERFDKVKVRYFTPFGGEKVEEFVNNTSTPWAHCVQHEMDHLEGRVLSDLPETAVSDEEEDEMDKRSKARVAGFMPLLLGFAVQGQMAMEGAGILKK